MGTIFGIITGNIVGCLIYIALGVPVPIVVGVSVALIVVGITIEIFK